MRAPYSGSADTVQFDHSFVGTEAIEADIRANSAKGPFVRSAAVRTIKMLRNMLNGCFGEAAMQQLDIWSMAALGRSRRSTQGAVTGLSLRLQTKMVNLNKADVKASIEQIWKCRRC
jgi:hypothetical protein